MGQSDNAFDSAWAFGTVDSDAAGLTKTRGCRVTVAANVYTFTLDKELDEYDAVVNVIPRGASSAAAYFCAINHVSDSVKEVRFFFTSGGALQPVPFHISFRRFANGNQ